MAKKTSGTKKAPATKGAKTSATTGNGRQDLPSDLAALSREELLEVIETRHDGGIHIDFAGKSNARKLARKVRPRTLRTLKKYGIGSADEQSKNLVIEGDNLQAMATLYRERGQVDLVLTDPPYNTGNDWRYNDRWEDDPNDPGLGEWVSVDDGARHTKWMRFMWPRLQMMKAMLKPNGVLAICIDHRELFRLGPMLNELFGERNRLAIINWQKSYSPRGDRRHVSTATEYVLVYAKDSESAKTELLPRTEDMDRRYGSPDGDPRAWKSGDLSAGKGKLNQGMMYAIQSPFTGELHYPPPGCCWRLAQREVTKALEAWGVKYRRKKLEDDEQRAQLLGVGIDELKAASGLVLDEPLKKAQMKAEKTLKGGPWPRVYFGLDGQGRPALKRYLDQVQQGKVPTTWWAGDDYDEPLEVGSVSWPHQESGHSQTGVQELDAIAGGTHGFATVKPLRLFSKLIQVWCPPDGLVLDPFAGSGTTAHAVLDLNKKAGAERRFTLIEQGRPDRGDPYARALLAGRLQRVVKGDWAAGQVEPLGGGYRFGSLDKKVDAQALLNMEREELADTIIGSHFDAERRQRESLVTVATNGDYKYLVARNSEDEGFFLIWSGPDKNTDLTEDAYELCAKEAIKAGLKPRYHIYARLYIFQTSNVVFYQIPDRILMDFGVDLRGEPYHEAEA